MPHFILGWGIFKTKQMAKKEITKIEIVCRNSKECSVDISGDRKELVAALASLIADDDENNEFHQLIHVAMAVVMFEKQRKESPAPKKAAKKKAAPVKKKSVVKKAAPVKKKK